MWFLALGVMVGCAEHWVASDAVGVAFRGPGEIGVRVTTTPEAWPDERYGDAVRAAFYGSGPVRLVDVSDHEILQGDDDWVNVLDAWRGCDPGEVCVRELWFDVGCYSEACEGEFEVDAFFSTYPLPEPRVEDGITLTLLAPEDDGGPVIGR